MNTEDNHKISPNPFSNKMFPTAIKVVCHTIVSMCHTNQPKYTYYPLFIYLFKFSSFKGLYRIDKDKNIIV